MENRPIGYDTVSLIEKKNFSLREEFFGYTFYDKTKLRHEFIRKDSLDSFLIDKGIKDGDCELLIGDGRKTRTDILYSPIRIYYELTLACNIRCRCCFNNSGTPREDELSLDEITKSFISLKRANVLDLRFTGGELTVRPDWYDILKTAKDFGFAVSCNTNGLYKDSLVPEKFAKLNLDQVTLSIDGKKENHEKNRGLNTFNQTLENLKLMSDLGVKLRINTLITKNSLKDVDYMVDLASKYCNEINFFITRPIGRGRELKIDELVNFEEFYRMSLEADKLRSYYPNLNIIHFEGATVQNSSRSGKFDEFGLKMGPPDGTTRFNILSNGDMFAGGYIPYVDRSFLLGNIKMDDLVEVWQTNEKLEWFRNSSRDLEEYCGGCVEFSRRCPGPNYELELLKHNLPEIDNPYCFYPNRVSLLDIIENKKNG